MHLSHSLPDIEGEWLFERMNFIALLPELKLHVPRFSRPDRHSVQTSRCGKDAPLSRSEHQWTLLPQSPREQMPVLPSPKRQLLPIAASPG